MPVDELGLRSPAEWAAIVLSNLEFCDVRAPGQARIRVFDPPADSGFGNGFSVVQIVNDDMSFLVDSVGMALAAHGLASHGIVHPVFPISRDGSGKLLAVGTGAPESLIHIDVDRIGNEEDRQAVQASIASALADVRAAFGDWQAMRGKMAT